MRELSNFEQKHVNGGEISFLIPVDTNQEVNFTSGFSAGVDTVGGVIGFFAGITASIVVLPCRAIYSVCSNIYSLFK